jgi:hypothetical protein
MSRAKWTEAEAAGAAKEADRMSVTAAGYAKARSEIIGLFGWNPGVLSPDQMLRLDCAVALRLALDDLQGRLIRGEPIDMNRMLTASEALAKLLPPAVLASPPPEMRSDPRAALLEMILQMRDRDEIADRAEEPSLREQVAALEAENMRLRAELAALKAGAPSPAPNSPPAANVVSFKAASAAPAPAAKASPSLSDVVATYAPPEEPWREFSGGGGRDRWSNRNE